MNDLQLKRPDMIMLGGHIFRDFMPSVSPEAFVVMMRLIYQADTYGEQTEYFGSIETFCELTGLKLPQLKRGLKELAELGYAEYNISNKESHLYAVGIFGDDNMWEEDDEDDDDDDEE